MATLDSKHLGFGFDDLHSLRNELGQAFVAIYVTLDRCRIPMELVLWRQDGSGLAVWSEMHDLAEKVEVGVLKFAITIRDKVEPPDGYWETGETFSFEGLNGEHSVSKLVVEESGYECESGVVLSPTTGQEIVIVADAFPCHVAVLGLEGLKSGSLPEYKLSDYKRVPW